jgi:hypothetical protein
VAAKRGANNVQYVIVKTTWCCQKGHAGQKQYGAIKNGCGILNNSMWVSDKHVEWNRGMCVQHGPLVAVIHRWARLGWLEEPGWAGREQC